MVAIPATAGAVLSGVNGRIVFASGRGAAANDDSTAKLFLRPTIGSIGAGTAVPIPTATGTQQHRHPTWSPDRTRIAYAEGDPGTMGVANFDIFILDLTDPNATPQNITNSINVTDDRPAWSPDGTRIAFESENSDQPPNDAPAQLNIKIYTVATGNTTDLTLTNIGYEHKPAWTPDSQTLYYATGNPFTGLNTMDIVRQPAAGGAPPQDILAEAGVSEFQPSISPDGNQMCYTRGTGFNSSARVYITSANGGAGSPLPGNDADGDYNCTWSPDGTKIAYVHKTFQQGDLWMENSNLDPALPNFFGLETTAQHFDGNPDWAPDGRPSCQDRTVITTQNTPVSILVSCPDSGPAYEQTEVRGVVSTEPLSGTVSPGLVDPAVTLPTNFTYTPNAGFLGTDSFKVLSFDQVSFGDREGTMTVRVTTPCDNRTPTVLGTAGADQLAGTSAADVIDALDGNDTVTALEGNDLVCGGPGNDTLNGGPGNDKLLGGPGKDTLKGGGGKDKLLGQQGKDKLKGGKGKDTCKGGKGKDTASACEVRKSI